MAGGGGKDRPPPTRKKTARCLQQREKKNKKEKREIAKKGATSRESFKDREKRTRPPRPATPIKKKPGQKRRKKTERVSCHPEKKPSPNQSPQGPGGKAWSAGRETQKKYSTAGKPPHHGNRKKKCQPLKGRIPDRKENRLKRPKRGGEKNLPGPKGKPKKKGEKKIFSLKCRGNNPEDQKEPPKGPFRKSRLSLGKEN